MPIKKARASKPSVKKTAKDSSERRRALRGAVKLLTAFRSLDPNTTFPSGFVRTLNLSPIGALLESPDPFEIGQRVALEFLLDNNQIAKVNGIVKRCSKRELFYQVAIEYVRLSAKAKRLIIDQVSK